MCVVEVRVRVTHFVRVRVCVCMERMQEEENYECARVLQTGRGEVDRPNTLTANTKTAILLIT